MYALKPFSPSTSTAAGFAKLRGFECYDLIVTVARATSNLTYGMSIRAARLAAASSACVRAVADSDSPPCAVEELPDALLVPVRAERHAVQSAFRLHCHVPSRGRI